MSEGVETVTSDSFLCLRMLPESVCLSLSLSWGYKYLDGTAHGVLFLHVFPHLKIPPSPSTVSCWCCHWQGYPSWLLSALDFRMEVRNWTALIRAWAQPWRGRCVLQLPQGTGIILVRVPPVADALETGGTGIPLLSSDPRSEGMDQKMHPPPQVQTGSHIFSDPSLSLESMSSPAFRAALTY